MLRRMLPSEMTDWLRQKIIAVQKLVSYTVFLSAHQAQQIYRIDGVHPPGHPVTAAVLRIPIKGT